MDCKKVNVLRIIFLLVAFFHQVKCQSVDKLREDTTVDIAHYGEIKTAITTNKTKAFLSCESGDMIVTIDFKDPFFGIIYANRDPLSPCNVEGNGKTAYTIRLPLQGCGTREDPPRTFINDIVVRFRRGLIVDEDEVKTIICRYGPPVPPPVVPITPLPPLPEPPGIVAKPKKLTEAEIYVIICFLLFLALLLLGVGLAYYCLKKRNIKIVRKRRALSSAPASEITKLSGSTMGTLSAFDGFRIPRATAHSTSGSEAALLTQDHISDTIPSDYPSESPSSMQSDGEEIETRRDTTIVSESSTIIDDNYRYDNHLFLAEPPASSQPRSLTTIYEQDYLQRIEDRDQSLLSARRLLQHQLIPPVYAKIRKKQYDTTDIRDETTLESELTEEYARMRFAPLPLPPPFIPRVNTATVSETRSVSEFVEEVSRREPEPIQLPHYDEVDALVPLHVAEPPVLSRGPPATTRHTIDDYYLTTITEMHTQEDELKRTRETTASHMKEPPPTKWDVMIRTYPPEIDDDRQSGRAPTVTTDSENDQWDQLSYISERPQSLYGNGDSDPPPPLPTVPPPPNWNVLIRVLKPNLPSEPSIHGDDVDSVDELSEDDRERWKKIITTDTTLRTKLQEARTVEELENIRQDRRYEKLFEPQKWDVIIRILSEPQEPDRARSDTSSTISESAPSITSSHSGTSGQYSRKYRKKSDPMDNRSRRSSLPPVYEYEDFNIAGTITPTTTRSRRTSRSSDYDLQSEGPEDEEQDDQEEDEVRYERRPTSATRAVDVASNWSADSDDVLNQYLTSGRGPIARSIAERSTTEVIENISRVYEQQRPHDMQQHSGHYSANVSTFSSRSPTNEAPYGRITSPQHRSPPPPIPAPSSYSPTSSASRGHRQIERSSTEILVNSPSLMRMAGRGSREDEMYSETNISDYMR